MTDVPTSEQGLSEPTWLRGVRQLSACAVLDPACNMIRIQEPA